MPSADNDAHTIRLFQPHVSAGAGWLVSEVLESGWLSEGRMVKRFEQALTTELGLLNPVALNSGTSALHLALAVAGAGPGDEVILPAQTFVATAMAVLIQRAAPVFADIDPRTGNIHPASIRAKITERTKALIPVHWAGYPCDMDEINSLAAEHGLTVIEDAAHALGATYKGTPVGAISRFTAFSFQAIKHLTTGDGGALCCSRVDDYHTAVRRRWFGIDRETSRPSPRGEREYDLTEPGYKYHMNDLSAAVGLGNLEGFHARLARRRQIAAIYREALGGVPGLRLLQCSGDRQPAYWVFTLLAERREDFIRKLAGAGIEASVVHLRIDKHRLFGGVREDLAGQAEFDAAQVSIPVHPGLSDEQVDAIIRTICSGW